MIFLAEEAGEGIHHTALHAGESMLGRARDFGHCLPGETCRENNSVEGRNKLAHCIAADEESPAPVGRSPSIVILKPLILCPFFYQLIHHTQHIVLPVVFCWLEVLPVNMHAFIKLHSKKTEGFIVPFGLIEDSDIL